MQSVFRKKNEVRMRSQAVIMESNGQDAARTG
jgi:hypothetical protein